MIPNRNGTIKLTATTAPQTVALPPGGGLSALFTNLGPDTAFIETGPSTVTALASTSNSSGGGAPITANQIIPYHVRTSDTHVSVVSAGTSTVYMTLGREP